MKVLFINTCCFLLILSGCNLKLDGRPGRSKSIEESKKRNAFIEEYHLIRSTDNIPDVKEAWLERSWRFTKYSYEGTQFASGDGQQFCINLDRKVAEDLFKSWSLERDSTVLTYGVYGDNTLVVSIRNSASDTLSFSVYKGDDKNVRSANDLIGKLTFVKASN